MRRMFFSLLIIVSLVLFCACSENNKTILEPEFNGVDFDNDIMNSELHDFFVSIQKYDGIPEDDPELKTHFLWFGPLDEFMPVGNVTLEINNEIITEDWSFNSDYMYSYTFKQGMTYQIKVTANDYSTTNLLKIPYDLKVTNFPEKLSTKEDYTLKWKLEKDNQTQFVNLYDGVNDLLLESISPKFRAFTFKKDLTKEYEKSYTIYIYNINYISSGRFVLYSISGDEKKYSFDRNLCHENTKLSRNSIMKIVKQIDNIK